MKFKHILILVAMASALIGAATIGMIIPENYPMPEAVQPQASNVAPVAPQAPVPIAPQPGHPGAMYTQLTATCYGPIRFDSINVSADINGTGHISKDNLSAWIDFACDTRETATVYINVSDNYGRDVNTIYITVKSQPGVEVNLNATTGKLKHITPGIWVGKSEGGWLNISVDIYGQPINSGYRYITMTFSAE